MLLAQWLFADSTIQFPARIFTVDETVGQVEPAGRAPERFGDEVAVEYLHHRGYRHSQEQDFAAVSGTLSFAAGVTNQTIHVPILNDALVESLERFQVVLTNATGGAVLGSMKVATVSIQDNDTPVEFTTTDYFVGEADGVIEVPVVRGDDGDLPVTIDYATADGTALAGVDYEAINGTLTFETGRTTKFVTVPILNDTLMEGTKTFFVQLSNLQGASVLGAKTNATVSIVDNETLVQLEFTTYRAREDEGSVLIGLVRGGEGRASSTGVRHRQWDGACRGGLHGDRRDAHV